MSTLELKIRLKEKIEGLNEVYFLEYLLGLIEIEESSKDFDLPELHKKSIDIGLAQIKSGHTFSNKEVIERLQKWSDE